MAGQSRRLKWGIGQILSPDSDTAILQTWLEKKSGGRTLHIFIHEMVDFMFKAWYKTRPDKKHEYESGKGKGGGKGKGKKREGGGTSSSSTGKGAGKGKGKHPAWDPDPKYKLGYDIELHSMEKLPHFNAALAETMWEMTGLRA